MAREDASGRRPSRRRALRLGCVTLATAFGTSVAGCQSRVPFLGPSRFGGVDAPEPGQADHARWLPSLSALDGYGPKDWHYYAEPARLTQSALGVGSIPLQDLVAGLDYVGVGYRTFDRILGSGDDTPRRVEVETDGRFARVVQRIPASVARKRAPDPAAVLPQITWGVDHDRDARTVTLAHEAGETVAAVTLSVRGSEIIDRQYFADFDQFGPGDSVTVELNAGDADVTVLYESPGGTFSVTLLDYGVPAGSADEWAVSVHGVGPSVLESSAVVPAQAVRLPRSLLWLHSNREDMKNIDDLMSSAAELADRGLSKGEIADELNVSRETASWLVERSDEATPATTQQPAQTGGPHDIHVDWSAIGRDSNRMWHVGSAMADLLSKQGEDVDLTIGIEKAGAPLATAVARELDTDLGSYAPAKHQWEEGDMEDLGGTFSRNFAQIRDRECYVVDDTITSGTTMTETVQAIRDQGGEPVACVVLVDKKGTEEIEGVPVYSLVQVIRVGNDDS